MRSCWTFSPGDRISFRAIVNELVPYENENFRLHAYYHTQNNLTQHADLFDSCNNDEEELLLANKSDGDNEHTKHGF